MIERAEVMQMDESSIMEIEDVERLLDIRSEALGVAADIARQIEAQDTLPVSHEGWRTRAQMARRHAITKARYASVRILELAPELLSGERREDETEDSIIAQMRAAIERRSARIKALLAISAQRNRQIRNMRGRIERQAAQLQIATDQLAGSKSVRDEERQAARRERMAAEAEQKKSFERRFFAAAKAMLTGEQFAAICERVQRDMEGVSE